MGIFKRINELVKANINDLLGRVEDPEKMLNQLMLELREEKRKAHLQVVRCIADEKRLEQQIRDHQDKLGQWQKRAEVAVMRDEDDLAREAISRRNEYATMVDELTRQWEEQHQMAEQLKDGLEMLERRYKEAEFKKQHLVNKYRGSLANKQAAETLGKLSGTDHSEQFSKVEQRIQDMSANASAQTEMAMPSLESKFAALESEGVVEHDLLQLKMQMGKSAPSLPGGNGASGPAALPGTTAAGSPPPAQGAHPAATPAPVAEGEEATFS